MGDDINLLVNETLKFVGNFKNQNPFNKEHKVEYPNSCGFLYSIFIGSGSFCIKCRAVENIKKAFENIENEVNFGPFLGINPEEIKYFETDYLEIAEVIVDFIGGRRLSLKNDLALNLNDPYQSWWFYMDNKNFKINSRMPTEDCINKYLKAGPLGDFKISFKRIMSIKYYLEKSLNVEIKSDNKYIINFKFDKINNNLTEFLNLFIKGESPKNILSESDIGRTNFLFFNELAAMRKFWIKIEKHLF